ncbi:hypothetical protein Droror1_Dr00000006 [Drosera rotundifolia]
MNNSPRIARRFGFSGSRFRRRGKGSERNGISCLGRGKGGLGVQTGNKVMALRSQVVNSAGGGNMHDALAETGVVFSKLYTIEHWSCNFYPESCGVAAGIGAVWEVAVHLTRASRAFGKFWTGVQQSFSSVLILALHVVFGYSDYCSVLHH